MNDLQMKNFRYRWKNGRPPTAEEALRDDHLLDADQFDNPRDHHLAEQTARRQLGLPMKVEDFDRGVLPQPTLADIRK